MREYTLFAVIYQIDRSTKMKSKATASIYFSFVILVITILFLTIAMGPAIVSTMHTIRETHAENEALKEQITKTTKLIAEAKPAAVHKNVIELTDYITARYTKVPEELAEIIALKTHTMCEKHRVDFHTVVGIMEVESTFNPFSTSSVGAVGLMQVMPNIWAKEFEIEKRDLYNIETNIEAGIKVFKRYVNKNKGNITKALQNYNGNGAGYAEKVYTAIGRFVAYRNSFYAKGDSHASNGGIRN